jgi:predicted phage-related endonuclease
MTDLTAISNHIEIYRTCKSRIAELEELAAKSRAVIEETLGSSESGTVCGYEVVTWKRTKVKRVNQGRLRQDHPEIVESYVEVSEQRTMRLV